MTMPRSISASAPASPAEAASGAFIERSHADALVVDVPAPAHLGQLDTYVPLGGRQMALLNAMRPNPEQTTSHLKWAGFGLLGGVTTMGTVSICLHSGPLAHVIWPVAGALIGLSAATYVGVSMGKYVVGQRAATGAEGAAAAKTQRHLDRAQALSMGALVGIPIIPVLHAALAKDTFYSVTRWLGGAALGLQVVAGAGLALAALGKRHVARR